MPGSAHEIWYLQCESHRPPRKVDDSCALIIPFGAKRELVEGIDGSMQMALGEMQINGGVFQALVSHQQLDSAQIGARLQQMRGKAMPERMRPKLFLDTGPNGRRPTGVPHGLVGDGLLAAAIAHLAGKEINAGFLPAPVVTQYF